MTRAGDAEQYSTRIAVADPDRGDRDTLAPSMAQPEPKISLSVIVNVLMIWKWIIMAIVAAFFAAGVILLEFTSPSYEASASVMLGDQGATIFERGTEIVEDVQLDTPTIGGQIEVMQSRDLVERVIDKLDLVNDPDFSPNARIRLVDGPDAPVLSDEENMEELVRAVSGGLSVRQVGLTTVISMRYTAGSADKAALLANTFAANYIDSQLESKTNTVDDIAGKLSSRLEELRNRVREAELALSQARANDALVDGQSLETVNAQINELSTRLVQAVADRVRAEATLANIDRAAELGRSLEVLLELRESPIVENLSRQREDLKSEIAGLQPRLLDRHPQMVSLRDQLASISAQIDVELQGQADRLRIQYQAALAQEAALQQNIRRLEAQKTSVDIALQRVAELQREAAVEQQLYERSLSRFREIDEQRSFIQPDATIIERAAPPPWPSAPRKKLIVAFATALGIMTALGLVLVVEATRDTFTNPGALFVHTGVPVMGVLPKLRRLRIDQKMPGRLAGSVSGREALESARRIFTTLVPRDGVGQTQVIGVTSALPADGKTFISMLLGQVAAGAQKKTLLIDADLRKPGLYPALNVKDFDGRGLTSIVPGVDSLQAHTWRHPDLALHILPADAGGKRIAFDEYSQIKKLAQIIEDARKDFDVIIVRMPPVVPSSDAMSIAPLVDEVLFVVSWNKTKRGTVWKGMSDLASIDAYPAGMILNAADMKRANQSDFYGQNFDYGSVQKYYS